MLSREEILELVYYDKDSGEILWKANSGAATLGRKCGWTRPDGYRQVYIKKHPLLLHRVIWLLENGEWPSKLIDHINGDKSDNRITNLRLANNEQNGRNSKIHLKNKSGERNVFWREGHKKWEVSVRVNKKTIYLGWFKDYEFACLVAQEARDKFHKEYATNRK